MSTLALVRQPTRVESRRELVIATCLVIVFGVLHHLDHVVRGTHSGWPFQSDVTPFTYSLLIYALLLPGLYLTVRGRVMAGFWIFTSLVILALVASTHLGPQALESVSSIYTAYKNPIWGTLAVVDLFALLFSLVLLLAVAVRALRATKGS